MKMDIKGKIEALKKNMEGVIYGKGEVIDLTIIALLARGHLLIEDVPGVGKTTLAYALARSLSASFRRIQFTSDLLPSDILGVSVFDQSRREFTFKPGPIFANIVLADEINRTTPKTQSALLEAMNDYQVSVDSKTYRLPQPFMVLATQNPLEFHGTHPLPESQMDRFLMRIRIGYPDKESEVSILRHPQGPQTLEAVQPVMTTQEVIELQRRVEEVQVEPSLMEYILTLASATRRAKGLRLGVSPRGSLHLYRAAQAKALISGRDYCIPDDIKGLAVFAFAHRVIPAIPPISRQGSGGQAGLSRPSGEAERVMEEVISSVPVPL